MFTSLLNFIVRREGKKFLQLNEEVDELKIVPVQKNHYEEASLYVHIPFCKTLCPYCSFNRYRFEEDKARIYYKHLTITVIIVIISSIVFIMGPSGNVKAAPYDGQDLALAILANQSTLISSSYSDQDHRVHLEI